MFLCSLLTGQLHPSNITYNQKNVNSYFRWIQQAQVFAPRAMPVFRAPGLRHQYAQHDTSSHLALSLHRIYFSHIKVVITTLDKWWEWLLFACRYFIIRPALIVPELAPGATGVASASTKKQLIHSRHNCG